MYHVKFIKTACSPGRVMCVLTACCCGLNHKMFYYGINMCNQLQNLLTQEHCRVSTLGAFLDFKNSVPPSGEMETFVDGEVIGWSWSQTLNV